MPEFTVPLSPVPASRPRVTRQGWSYYGEPYKSYKKNLTKWFKDNYSGLLLGTALLVAIEIVAQRPKTTKLPHPKPDVDNYAKATLDAMNKVVFEDDSLVSRLEVQKRWTVGTEKPHTRVTVSPR